VFPKPETPLIVVGPVDKLRAGHHLMPIFPKSARIQRYLFANIAILPYVVPYEV
jgi:hypothetical protein